ncbi:MAG TPA: MoxR family ATPase, partial [Planctomycetota bacterium]|nr:MoxR family ATPase [Planctomycetota bacterium]
ALLLATQNPIEQEGTYPLPEAQLDRFMFMIQVGYPSVEEEREILKRTTSGQPPEVNKVVTGTELKALQHAVREIPVADEVLNFAVELTRRTRVRSGEANDTVREFVTWGAGPRAGQFLLLGAKAHAAIHGRDYVASEDIHAVAHPVLRHRIVTNFSAQAEGVTSDAIISRLLESTQVGGAVGAGLPGLSSNGSKG